MKAKIKIHFLGTASGIPTKKRYNESIAITIGGECITKKRELEGSGEEEFFARAYSCQAYFSTG